MKQTWQAFQEIATYLKNSQSIIEIERLQKMESKKEIFVPLIGQFSAGKSHLLNNLFDRKILPTMSSETTAFLTYISYSSDENVYLTKKDGSRVEISFSQLSKLSQKTLEMDMSISELKMPVSEDDIESVHVYLHHPLLQNGLVFIDTPGLNTLIQRHENRTQTLLPQANAVIYVLGKSVTDSDLAIIKQIDSLGIDTIFVRTRLDEVKESEGEKIEDVLQKNVSHIQKVLQKDPVMYGVTNETEFLSMPKWRSRMDDLYTYLSHHVSSQVAELKELSIKNRLTLVASVMLQELQERKQQEQELKLIDDDVLKDQVEELERQIFILQKKMENQYQRGITEFKGVENRVYDDVKRSFEGAKKRFENEMNNYSTLKELQQESEKLSGTVIAEATNQANQSLKENIQAFILGMTTESNIMLAEVENHIEKSQELSLQLQMDVPSIEGVFDDVDYLDEQLAVSSINESRLEEMAQLQRNRALLEEEMVNIAQVRKESEIERASLGGYRARYKEEYSTNAADALGKLGSGLDLALLFLPGTALAKGATAVAKGANAISKASKVGKIAQQTAIIADKAAKAAKTIDKVKDALYVAKSVQEKVRNHEVVKKEPGFLDLVTVEFWFRKAGEFLDGPPRQVEDEEYREQFLAVERELTAKYEIAKQEELLRLQQLNLINSKEEHLKKEMEIEARNATRLQEEMKRQKERVVQQAKGQQVKLYRKQLVKQFHEGIDSLYKQHTDFVSQFLAEFIEKLPTSISMRLQQEVSIYRQKLTKAIEAKQLDEQEILQAENQMLAYIFFLQNYIQKDAVVVN